MAAVVVAQLLFLNMDDAHAPVKMYINSPGGVITSGMAIYDCMQLISNPIETTCVGQAASMGSVLLTAGTPGLRSALPNSKVMIHQPLGGAQGQASDIMIQVKLNNNLIIVMNFLSRLKKLSKQKKDLQIFMLRIIQKAKLMKNLSQH